MFTGHSRFAFRSSRKSSSSSLTSSKSRTRQAHHHHEAAHLDDHTKAPYGDPHPSFCGAPEAPEAQAHFLDRFPGSGCPGGLDGYRSEKLREVNLKWQQENGLCAAYGRAPSVASGASTTGTLGYGAPSSTASFHHQEERVPAAFVRQRKDGKAVICCVAFADGADEVREYVPLTPWSAPSAPEDEDLQGLADEDGEFALAEEEAPLHHEESLEKEAAALFVPQTPALHQVAAPQDIEQAVKRGEALDLALGGTGISRAVADACGTLFLPTTTTTTHNDKTHDKHTTPEPPRQPGGTSRAPRAGGEDGQEGGSGRRGRHREYVGVHRDLYVDAHRAAGQKESGFGGFLEGFFEFFRHKKAVKTNPRYVVHGSRMQAHVLAH